MTQSWYRFCHWLCVKLYFERVTLVHPEHLSAERPVLYIVLHRNGAVDGFVYHQVIPDGVFLVSTQLLRSGFSRLFFCGIAVVRKGDDDDQSQNTAALDRCTRLLADGGELAVFPEGTSKLGPRHLPFKSGAASIALDALAQGVPLKIVPLGIHYERAWAFRSKVEIVAGEAIPTDLPDGLSDLGRLKEMKRRMTRGLEAVGANFTSAEVQQTAECLAYTATLGTPNSYFAALKSLESGIPEALSAGWRDLEARLASPHLLRHQGVPLFPVGPWIGYALLLLLLGPLVVAGAVANLPPLLAAWVAARRFADDLNVIALWRILVGVPFFGAWFGGMALLLGVAAGPLWALAYVLLTVVALKALYRVKKLAVAVWNGLMHRQLAPLAHAFHQSILQTLPPP